MNFQLSNNISKLEVEKKSAVRHKEETRVHHIPGLTQASAECPPHLSNTELSGPVGKVNLACSLLDSERSASRLSSF